MTQSSPAPSLHSAQVSGPPLENVEIYQFNLSLFIYKAVASNTLDTKALWKVNMTNNSLQESHRQQVQHKWHGEASIKITHKTSWHWFFISEGSSNHQDEKTCLGKHTYNFAISSKTLHWDTEEIIWRWDDSWLWEDVAGDWFPDKENKSRALCRCQCKIKFPDQFCISLIPIYLFTCI